MSLIPNESYSFPDDFVRTVRLSKNARKNGSFPPPAERETLPKKPPSPPREKLPEPQNRVEEAAPSSSAAPSETSQPEVNPASDSSHDANAVTSVSLAEFLRMMEGANSAASAQASPANADVDSAPNHEVEVDAPPPEAEPDLEAEPYLERRKRSRRFIRFVTSEAVAISVLVPSAMVGLSHRFTDPILIGLINIFTISAAVAATIIPILFYARGPTLPRREP